MFCSSDRTEDRRPKKVLQSCGLAVLQVFQAFNLKQALTYRVPRTSHRVPHYKFSYLSILKIVATTVCQNLYPVKKGFLILLCVLASGSVYPQDTDTGGGFRAGVIGFGGWNLPVRMTDRYITEETSPWHGNQAWSAGIHLSWMITGFYRMEIAPRYSWHRTGFELSPPIYDEKTIYTETFELISIPLTFKRYIDKQYFISSGTIIDFAFSGKPERVDPQSGIGLSLGAGKEFRIKNFVIDVSPFAELHSIVPFESEDNQQRLFLGAMRISVSYNLKRRTGERSVNDELNNTIIREDTE